MFLTFAEWAGWRGHKTRCDFFGIQNFWCLRGLLWQERPCALKLHMSNGKGRRNGKMQEGEDDEPVQVSSVVLTYFEWSHHSTSSKLMSANKNIRQSKIFENLWIPLNSSDMELRKRRTGYVQNWWLKDFYYDHFLIYRISAIFIFFHSLTKTQACAFLTFKNNYHPPSLHQWFVPVLKHKLCSLVYGEKDKVNSPESHISTRKYWNSLRLL